jgi:hypothetical protein
MQRLWLSESSLARGIDGRQLFPNDRANEHLPWTAACGNDSTRSLASVMAEVEYPAVSVAIARFQNRLKTERSLQR